VRSIGTLDGLVRLAEFGFLQADEYRRLADGYVFLRTVEHALQLAHHKQTHSLPEDRRELAYLARKLDYPDADTFLLYYERHCTAVRAIWEKYLGEREAVRAPVPSADPGSIPAPLAHMEPSYAETFGEAEIERHSALLDRLTDENVVELDAVPLDDGRWRLTLVGYDHLGDLSAMCGLLSVHGCNIVDGHAFSDSQIAIRQSSRRIGTEAERRNRAARKFVNVFTVVPPPGADAPAVWLRYRHELAGLLRLDRAGSQREAQAQLARRVAETFRLAPEAATPLYPVDVRIDNETSPGHTVLHIRSEDTIGFLYELANALALSGIDVARVTIVTDGRRVVDTLYVTDSTGRKIVDPRRQQELRTAVVLIKHFTHLLPRSPNPEAALLHFGDFLEKLLREPDRLADLASLERSEVLEALARLLGVSNFLWEDFLRLQHANLFPVVQDVEALAEAKSKVRLAAELRDALAPSRDAADRRERLNAFKDREMFRTDMRHILGHVTEFGRFSAELSDLAEVVVEAAFAFCGDELGRRYGSPRRTDGAPCAAAVLALGKCGGRELGYASDIELMIVYEDQGTTDGPDPVTTTEFFLRLVESFSQAIRSRSEGIFQIDLRLRPYGRAGSLAVAFDAFRTYYAPDGPAWPYERQSLVKLRPIAGDAAFGARIAALRDELVYTGEPFDVAALRGMREKQIRQLVEAGTIHAKLGPGGLVDCEYLVQGLQIAHGRAHPELRTTNTVEAMDVLCRLGILSSADHARLRAAYVFLRELIDALRMVRGHARDLTVPPAAGDEFAFLARRLGYDRPDRDLQDDLLRHMEQVRDLGRLLEG
jgi:glutamate-ammonia-ligase adenylyltransferase